MKRVIDIFFSLFIIVLLSPVIVLIGLLVRLKIGSPVLFTQERPGLKKKSFKLYKFRTMTDELDEKGCLLPEVDRMTLLGRTIRNLSLDELPQLWNVFIGDMSVVGPRPLLMKYLPLYNNRQAHRHEVRPGITGWAQVNGRNSISWEKKFEYDIWYVENQSLWLDCKIVFLTVKKVIMSEGINRTDSLPMEDFKGTENDFLNLDSEKRRRKVNILITSAGRRVKVVQYFKRELVNINGSIITSDLDSNAPALYFSDFEYIVSEIHSDNYVNEIIDICKKHSISAILTLIDPELEILAKNKAVFIENDIKTIVSDLEMINMSFDKFQAHNFFQENELPTVPTFIEKDEILSKVYSGEYDFPLIVKPRKGSGSTGITVVKNLAELHVADDSMDEMVFQPYYKDKEFGVDVYIDLISGKLVNLFIKEKLRMRSGETDKSISVYDLQIESLIIDLINKTNFKGPIDIDVFKLGEKFYISEINPRFGGGYPHAFECGVNFPDYIIKNLNGSINQEYSGYTYEEGIVMMKHDDVLIR